LGGKLGQKRAWPSDVQQWPSGQTEPLKAAKGRADLRAAKRSAASAAQLRPQKNQLKDKHKKGEEVVLGGANSGRKKL